MKIMILDLNSHAIYLFDGHIIEMRGEYMLMLRWFRSFLSYRKLLQASQKVYNKQTFISDLDLNWL